MGGRTRLRIPNRIWQRRAEASDSQASAFLYHRFGVLCRPLRPIQSTAVLCTRFEVLCRSLPSIWSLPPIWTPLSPIWTPLPPIWSPLSPICTPLPSISSPLPPIRGHLPFSSLCPFRFRKLPDSSGLCPLSIRSTHSHVLK